MSLQLSGSLAKTREGSSPTIVKFHYLVISNGQPGDHEQDTSTVHK